jgi:hypothetical protein
MGEGYVGYPVSHFGTDTQALIHSVLIAGGTDWCVSMRRRHEAVPISCVLIQAKVGS